MSARTDILARIAAAHQMAPPPELLYQALERGYRTTSALGPDELVEQFVDRLLDYKALVRRTTAAELPQTIAQALSEHDVRTVVVPDGVDPTWLDATEVTFVGDPGPDGPLSVDTLDSADGVITRCALAIAATGTLVLDATHGQGRRVASLIPDYHLCVVDADQVVADVPQAIARLEPGRATTMISGPSATSDIELDRVEGVHGPRTLEVVLVEHAAPRPAPGAG